MTPLLGDAWSEGGVELDMRRSPPAGTVPGVSPPGVPQLGVTDGFDGAADAAPVLLNARAEGASLMGVPTVGVCGTLDDETLEGEVGSSTAMAFAGDSAPVPFTRVTGCPSSASACAASYTYH